MVARNWAVMVGVLVSTYSAGPVCPAGLAQGVAGGGRQAADGLQKAARDSKAATDDPRKAAIAGIERTPEGAADDARKAAIAGLARTPRLAAAMKAAGFGRREPLPAEDVAYLKALAADTWRCIADLVHAETGLPCDNSERGQNTSVSNIGIYLTSLLVAREMGLIQADEAARRLQKTLDSVDRLRKWHGFTQSWNTVDTLEPATHDTWISVLDSGNLAGGLLAVANGAPQFAPACRKLLDAMEWSFFYDDEQGFLIGGYDTAKNELNRKWLLNSLGTDAQLAQFLAVAAGGAPPAMWDKLERKVETKYDAGYLAPGWQGGGLFMQYISGLWLDRAGTLMGQSAENFAYAQIAHRKAINAPVWGWSASAGPDGNYLGWGALRDDVVTPHACVLAIGDFPMTGVKNLRALERLGARSTDNGFYDAVDWKTGKLAKKFLILDQGMLFIGVGNYLHDGVVRKWVQGDPLVRRGRELVGEFARPAFAGAAAKPGSENPPP